MALGDDYVVNGPLAPEDAPPAPVDPAPDAAPPAGDPAASAPAPTPPEPTEAEQAAQEAKRRSDRAFAEQRRQIQALEAENARLRAQPPAPAPEPTVEDTAQATLRQQVQQLLAEERAAQAAAEQQRAWQAQETEIRTQHPDYDEAITALDIPFHPAILQALQTSPQGAALAYHLATHPQEAEEVARAAHANPVAGLMILGQLAGQLQAPAPASSRPSPTPATPLPRPITPLNGNGAAQSTVSPDQMDFDDFRAWWKKTYGGQ